MHERPNHNCSANDRAAAQRIELLRPRSAQDPDLKLPTEGQGREYPNPHSTERLAPVDMP
jgi:hypothetical protein